MFNFLKNNRNILGLLLISFFLIGCTSEVIPNADVEEVKKLIIKNQDPIEVEVYANHPLAVIEIITYGTVVIELYPEIAPNTVNNFISLASEGFYDNLIVHRVIEGFMIQSGDPFGNGSGGPGYTIDAEFSNMKDGFVTYLPHERGIVSMARSTDVNSAGSQFFIVHEDSHSLDLHYSSFGKVVEGMDVIDLIASTETGEKDNPLKDVEIQSIVIELNGYEWIEPIVNTN